MHVSYASDVIEHDRFVRRQAGNHAFGPNEKRERNHKGKVICVNDLPHVEESMSCQAMVLPINDVDVNHYDTSDQSPATFGTSHRQRLFVFAPKFDVK